MDLSYKSKIALGFKNIGESIDAFITVRGRRGLSGIPAGRI